MGRTNEKHSIAFKKQLLALVVASALSACASMNHVDGFSEEELKLSQYATLTSTQAITQLEQNLSSPDNRELPIYAPGHYQTAGKALQDAQKLLTQNGSRDLIVQKVAVGNAILQNGNRVVEKVKDNLSNELTLKQKLESLNTDNVYRSEYGGLLERLNKVIQSVEAGKTEDVAENREQLLKDMQRLEQKARRYNAMHEPEEILKRVKYSGGEKLAPLTYNEALEVFKRADDFIKQNPSYEAGIEQVGKEALFAAKRALYITQEVAALGQKFTLAPEQIVLDEEYRLRRISRELSDDDFRDHPIEVQSELLADAAKSHARELKNKDDLVIALRDTLIKVRDSSTELSELGEENLALKAERDNWQAKDALYRSKIDDLESKLNATIAQLDSTQQKLLQTSTNNELLTKQLDENKMQLASAQTQLKASESTDNQQLQEQLSSNQALQSEIALLKEKEKGQQEKITQLEGQLTALLADNEQTRLAMSGATADKTNLALELENSKKSLSELSLQLGNKEKELEQLQAIASDTATSADQKLQEQLAKNTAIAEDNLRLQNENKAQQEKIATLEKQLTENNALIAQTNQDISNTAADKAFLTIDLETTKQEIESLKQQLAEANSQLTTAQTQLKQTSETATASQTASQQEKEQWLAKDKSYQESIKQLEQKLTETNAQLATAQTQLQQINTDIASLTARNEQLTQELASAKQNDTDLNRQLAEVKNQAAEETQTARVTEEETMEALKSARELIKDLQASKTESNNSQNGFGEDIFVDSGE